MKTIFLFLLCCVSVLAQTQQDLRKKYGNPVSESYEVRPNILLTVSYGKEGQICRMSIKPIYTELNVPEATDKLLAAVADEVVPAGNRGANIINGFYSGAQIFGTSLDYSKLKISYITAPENWRGVGILWKDKSCNKFPDSKPFTFSTPPK